VGIVTVVLFKVMQLEDTTFHPNMASFQNPSIPHLAAQSSFNVDSLLSQEEIGRLMKEVRTESFDDQRLLRFIGGCNNGQGLSENDQATLFAMFHKGFDPRNLHVKSVRQLKKYEAESLHLNKDVSLSSKLCHPWDAVKHCGNSSTL
jgi:hypothetical protein